MNSKNSLKIRQDFRHGEKGVLVRGREEVLRINSDILKTERRPHLMEENMSFYILCWTYGI